MSEGNGSSVADFTLIGFPGLPPEHHSLVSALLFLVYFITLTANATVLFLFGTNYCLHKPVYYIILNLTICDILFSTTTLPKIISMYWFQSGHISFLACFVQMFFVHYLGSVNSFILFIMAFDRYFAVCHPFRYSSVLNNYTVLIFSATAWIVASLAPFAMVIRAYGLPYCASNRVMHCYCDHISITVLACTDRTPYALPAFIAAMITLLGPLAFIIFSYCSIIIAVSKIADFKNCLKSLSTCSTQLIIISLYFLPRCFVYLASNVGIKFSTDVRIILIMFYSLGPPMINPLIYCLRARDMQECLFKLLYRRTGPQRAQISAVSASEH